MNWLYNNDGDCAINPSKVEVLKIFYDIYNKKVWLLMPYTSTGAVHTIGSYDSRERAAEAMNNVLQQIKSEEDV